MAYITGDKGFNSKKARIALEEVIKGQYSYRRFNGTWISGKHSLLLSIFYCY